jgi:hypothetical protein
MGLFGKNEKAEKPIEGSIKAAEIVDDPSKIELISGKYAIIQDSNLCGGDFTIKNLPAAINLMANSGWRCVNIMGSSNSLYALMERI